VSSISIKKFKSTNHALVYRYYSLRKKQIYLVRAGREKYLEFRSYGKLLDFLRGVKEKVKGSAKKASHWVIGALLKLFNVIWRALPKNFQNKILEIKHSLYVFFKRIAIFVKNSYLLDLFIVISSIFSIGLNIYFFDLLKDKVTAIIEHFGELGATSSILGDFWSGLKGYIKHEIMHRATATGLVAEENLAAIQQGLSDSKSLIASIAPFLANKLYEMISKNDNKIISGINEVLSDLGHIAKKIARIVIKVFVVIIEIVFLYVLPFFGSVYFGYHSLKRIIEVISLRSFFFKEFVKSDFLKDIDEKIKLEIEKFINDLSFQLLRKDPVSVTELARLIDLSSLNYIDGAVYAAVNDDSDQILDKVQSYVKNINVQDKSKSQIKMVIANKYADYLINEVFSQEAAEKIIKKFTEFITNKVEDEKEKSKIINNIKKMQEKYVEKYGKISREALVEFIAKNTIFEIKMDMDSGVKLIEVNCDSMKVEFSKGEANSSTGIIDLRNQFRAYSIAQGIDRITNVVKKYFSGNELDEKDVRELDSTIKDLDETIQEVVQDGVEVDRKYEMGTVSKVIRGMKTFFSSNAMRIVIEDIDGIVQVPGEKCKEIRYKMSADITIPMVFGTLIEGKH